MGGPTSSDGAVWVHGGTFMYVRWFAGQLEWFLGRGGWLPELELWLGNGRFTRESVLVLTSHWHYVYMSPLCVDVTVSTQSLRLY